MSTYPLLCTYGSQLFWRNGTFRTSMISATIENGFFQTISNLAKEELNYELIKEFSTALRAVTTTQSI